MSEGNKLLLFSLDCIISWSFFVINAEVWKRLRLRAQKLSRWTRKEKKRRTIGQCLSERNTLNIPICFLSLPLNRARSSFIFSIWLLPETTVLLHSNTTTTSYVERTNISQVCSITSKHSLLDVKEMTRSDVSFSQDSPICRTTIRWIPSHPAITFPHIVQLFEFSCLASFFGIKRFLWNESPLSRIESYGNKRSNSATNLCE